MGYLDSSTITVDAILTKRGRELLARNDGSFNITQFALGDDEVDYTLFNENHPNGTQFSGEAIENMSLIEAIPDGNNIMRSKLITLERGTSTIPFISVGFDIIKVALGGTFTVSPTTINFNGISQGGVEPQGYNFTIHDVRLTPLFAGRGATSPRDRSTTLYSTFSATALSDTEVGTSLSGTAISTTALFGNNEKLLTSLTIEGRNSGARLTIPFEVSKNRTQVGPTKTEGIPSESI